MNLRELQIAILDEVDVIINEPVISPEEARANIIRLFDEARNTQTLIGEIHRRETDGK